jgi:hypothetical protein
MISSCLVLFGKQKIFSVLFLLLSWIPHVFFYKVPFRTFGAPSSFFNFFFSKQVERPGLVGIDRTTGKPVCQELPEEQKWLLRRYISATMFPAWIGDVGWICRVYKSQILFHRFCLFVLSANTNGAGRFRALNMFFCASSILTGCRKQKKCKMTFKL